MSKHKLGGFKSFIPNLCFNVGRLHVKIYKIAKTNTDRKLETCAILAGSEMNGALIIDTLIIPTQEGHTDHCYMTDEI